MQKYKLLEKIKYPADYRSYSKKDLIQLSNELREFIINTISKTPGHFGASLGVVELTVALHYVYNTPYDKIIWDVGHQAYGHKILTGRRENFNTLRQLNGISGFPNIFESEYDAFSVGHSSTSISAALGMAVASKLKQEERNVIAVIGDGSMTAGLAFEGMNNAGILNSDILIILNDNNMAIDPNVGGLKNYLLDITSSKAYNKVKEDVWNFLGRVRKIGPDTRKLIQKVENAAKVTLLKESNFFEGMQIRYFGPVDGHDVVHLTETLNDLKNIKGPKILHCITTKGKGFKYAEENQTAWHATSAAFNIETGKSMQQQKTEPQPPKFQDVFGETIIELAKENENIVGITPAMPSGCSLNLMMKEMPDRAFDVGIAEQHAVTYSAGLALQGFIPFCNIYSTFMQRAYDQVIHDVAMQNLHVIFCLDRGGLVGADGATHHGVFDLAYMRQVPNLIVSAPMDEEELRNLMFTAQLEKNNFPFSIRYPRGRGRFVDWKRPFKEIEIGKGREIKTQKAEAKKDIAILSIGAIGLEVIKATNKLTEENINVAHYDMRFVKPLDENLLHEIFKNFNKIITVENGTVIGGLGTAVIEFMVENNYNAKIIKLGVPDKFIEHGTQAELYNICGFDAEGIIKQVKKL